MLKLNIRVLLTVLVSLFVLYSLVSVVSAEPGRSLRLKPRLRPSSRSLRSTLEALADPSKRQQGVVCENYFCNFASTLYQCPDGCNNCHILDISIDLGFTVAICEP